MFRYINVVVYTLIFILLCGLIPLWAGIDPSVDRRLVLRVTAGCFFIIAYLLYRHHACVRYISFEKGHVFMGRHEPIMRSEEGYSLVYRSTSLVFAGLGWFARKWRPETGMMVFRKNRRYIAGMSLFDQIFPQSSVDRQVIFFGSWKRATGEIISDEIRQQIELICVQRGLTIKTVWIELELLGLTIAIILLLSPLFLKNVFP